jgi:hypothetical protein
MAMGWVTVIDAVVGSTEFGSSSRIRRRDTARARLTARRSGVPGSRSACSAAARACLIRASADSPTVSACRAATDFITAAE